MSDQGDDGLDHLHDQYGAAVHEPLLYAPQHESDASIHLPPQPAHDDLLEPVDDDEPEPHDSSAHATDSHLDQPEEDLYAEATAAAEAAAAASLESSQADETAETHAVPTDIAALQSALASKKAEVEALKKALKLRDRQIVRQANQQSTTSLIGEAVLARSNAAVASTAASAATHMGNNAAGLIGTVDPTKISNLQCKYLMWRFRDAVRHAVPLTDHAYMAANNLSALEGSVPAARLL